MTTTVTIETADHEVLLTRVDPDGREHSKTKFPPKSRSTLHLWGKVEVRLKEITE